MKKATYSLMFLVGTLALMLTAISPAQAYTAGVYSNPSTTMGYSVPGTAGTGFSSSLLSQLLTGGNQQSYFNTLTFSPIIAEVNGSGTSIPTGAPTNTQVLEFSMDSWWSGYSGFFMDTFTLPTNFTDASLSGAGNADDYGYVYLNGNLISTSLSEYSNTGFSDINQADFVAGLNQLVIADNNSGGGPSGAAYYANVSYETASAVPEPCTMFLLGSGLLGISGLRKKIK